VSWRRRRLAEVFRGSLTAVDVQGDEQMMGWPSMISQSSRSDSEEVSRPTPFLAKTQTDRTLPLTDTPECPFDCQCCKSLNCVTRDTCCTDSRDLTGF
jgi:hypothetical protein